MKMVKKVLMGLAAAAAVMALAGCVIEDDTEGAIKGSGKKYTVAYANETGTPYRAYKATALKHAGALVKVSFETTEDSEVKTSKMGVIFNLHNNEDNKDAKDFYIIGLNPTSTNKNFYVSKMSGIVDIQADNFGASTTASEGEPKEIEIVSITNNKEIAAVKADAGGIWSVYVYYKALTDGSFDYKVLNITDDVAKNFDLKEGTFDSSVVLAEGNTKAAAGAEWEECEEGKQPQNKVAFYAQIAAGANLEGSWNVIGTYLEAEDAE